MCRMNSPYESESDELDVFEATSYFSGATDGVATAGFAGSRGLTSLATEKRAAAAAVMAKNGMQQRRVLGDEAGSPARRVEEKKYWKRPSSPGAKLVSYLNHFFNQATPRKTLKCLNPSSAAGEEAKEGKEMQSRQRRRRRRSDALSCQSSKSSANFCGGSSFASPSSQRGIITSTDFETWSRRPAAAGGGGARIQNVGHEESKWVIDKPVGDGRLRRDWLRRGHHPHQLPFARATKDFTHFDHDDDEEEDGDEDLFELKNIYVGEDLSDGLPVFATTNIEVIKRKTAIPSSAS